MARALNPPLRRRRHPRRSRASADDQQAAHFLAADTRAPVLPRQLPLWNNVAEPIQLKIDKGAVAKVPVQTCTIAGCLASLALPDPLLAALRGGATIKITVSDDNKRSINIDVPLLGFGLACGKAK